LDEEFIESDYVVKEKIDYMTSALTVHPYPSFFRLWRNGLDTMVFAYTNLENKRTTLIPLQGSECQLVRTASFPSLLLEYHDTLSFFETTFPNPKLLELHLIYSIPFNESDFKSVTVASVDSTQYFAYFDSSKSEIFLSAVDMNSGFTRLIKSWHVEAAPDAMTISPETERIFFLNRSEAYVTVSTF